MSDHLCFLASGLLLFSVPVCETRSAPWQADNGEGVRIRDESGKEGGNVFHLSIRTESPFMSSESM